MDPLAILKRLGQGSLLQEITDALATTADDVVRTGKPGTVTITLKVSNKNIGDAFVMIEETVARTAPKRDAKGAYFYAVEGGLHRDDPRQIPIAFREVDDETGEIREPSTGATVREVSA